MAPLDPSALSAYPPGFESAPVLYLATVFSLILVMMLALEWTWRLIWSIFERPAPVKHPVTVFRIILLALLVGSIVRIAPDTWLLMRWPNLEPHERASIQLWDARLDAGAFIFMSLAWLTARLGDPFITFQLEKQPVPVHLWPTWRDLRRPMKIGVAVFAIAFALTYLR